jgi:hypothetical protein
MIQSAMYAAYTEAAYKLVEAGSKWRWFGYFVRMKVSPALVDLALYLAASTSLMYPSPM